MCEQRISSRKNYIQTIHAMNRISTSRMVKDKRIKVNDTEICVSLYLAGKSFFAARKPKKALGAVAREIG